MTHTQLSQSQFPGVDEAELKAMDRQITELQEQLKGRQAKCHGLESRKLKREADLIG